MSKSSFIDRLSGGLADARSPGSFSPSELKKGMKVEREHTKEKALAKEISMDHLSEDPDYYRKLDIMEKMTLKRLRKAEGELKVAEAFIEKIARVLLEKEASVGVGHFKKYRMAIPVVGSTAIGGAIGASASKDKKDRKKNTLRGMLYGAAAGAGMVERTSEVYRRRLDRMMQQHPELMKRLSKAKDPTKLIKPMNKATKAWDEMAKDELGDFAGKAAIGAGTGIGAATAGEALLKRMNKKPEDEMSSGAKKKRILQVIMLR